MKLVKYLRERENGDLFFSDKKRRNCLFYAVKSGNLALVQYLVSQHKFQYGRKNKMGLDVI